MKESAANFGKEFSQILIRKLIPKNLILIFLFAIEKIIEKIENKSPEDILKQFANENVAKTIQIQKKEIPEIPAGFVFKK